MGGYGWREVEAERGDGDEEKREGEPVHGSSSSSATGWTHTDCSSSLTCPRVPVLEAPRSPRRYPRTPALSGASLALASSLRAAIPGRYLQGRALSAASSTNDTSTIRRCPLVLSASLSSHALQVNWGARTQQNQGKTVAVPLATDARVINEQSPDNVR